MWVVTLHPAQVISVPSHISQRSVTHSQVNSWDCSHATKQVAKLAPTKAFVNQVFMGFFFILS